MAPAIADPISASLRTTFPLPIRVPRSRPLHPQTATTALDIQPMARSVASAGGELVLSESFDACDEARGPTEARRDIAVRCSPGAPSEDAALQGSETLGSIVCGAPR